MTLIDVCRVICFTTPFGLQIVAAHLARPGWQGYAVGIFVGILSGWACGWTYYKLTELGIPRLISRKPGPLMYLLAFIIFFGCIPSIVLFDWLGTLATHALIRLLP